MTFNAFETSVESGRPVELYEFRFGTEVFRLTSAEVDVLLGLETFKAVPIQRERIGANADPSQDRLKITLPASHDFAKRFVASAPGARVTLIVRRMHVGDPDNETIVIFDGAVHVAGYPGDGRTCELVALPANSATARPTPRYTYQNLCNHMLYDSRCKINESDPQWQKILPVTAVSGATITVTGAGAFGSDFFVAGFVAFAGDFRTVTAQATDVLTLISPFASSPLNQSVRCQAGCKLRLVDDCVNKFNNLVNFGGFPYVPTKNPFATGLE